MASKKRQRDGRPKKPKLSATEKVGILVSLVERIQVQHFHQPDSDAHEYCPGCGRSPYNEPPHADDCIVVKIERVIAKVYGDKKCDECGQAFSAHARWCPQNPWRKYPRQRV